MLCASMNASVVDSKTYGDLLTTTRRFTQSEDDARDLAHDVLEIALAKGVNDWSSSERQAWLRGVARRRAAFVLRGSARRKRRELLAGAPLAVESSSWIWEPWFLTSLPRSLRSLATLASADLCAAEVRWLLEITDTALRQRLSALRRALRGCEELPTLPAPEPEPRAAFGARRAQVLAHLQRRGGRAIATQDPDGHVIFLRMDAHKSEPSGNR
jgi:DNA-directed RNA polymerase specialized sigma24 family protein